MMKRKVLVWLCMVFINKVIKGEFVIEQQNVVSVENTPLILDEEVTSSQDINEISTGTRKPPYISNRPTSSPQKELSSIETTSETSTDNSEVFIDEDSTEDNKVKTTSGYVKGHKWRDNPNIIGYIDIPYGKITNPFEAPSVIHDEENYIYDEKEHKKMCPQIKNGAYQGEIDCLTLSIFVPKTVENASVLFHIHDPVIGNADPIVYGPEYIVSNNIIIVLPNYRISAPGFLCLLNKTAPGNAGLKDLSLALEWVKDNIEAFGGDSTNIVVSGDGSAGALVGYLALYSPSQHYFKKAMTESGSALSSIALDRHPLNTAQHIANIIREQSNNKELMNTFEEASLLEIVTAADTIWLKPCIESGDEGTFINDTPWQILNHNKINNTFMIGSASYAGTHEALELPHEIFNDLNTNFNQILPDDLHFDNINDKTINGEAIKLQYFGESSITADDIEPLSLCFTDALYLGPGIRIARSLAAAGAKIYFYEFDFVGALNQELDMSPRPVRGAVRNDIVGYVFKQYDKIIEEGSPEQRMVNLITELWTNFINDGVPCAADLNWNQFNNTSEAEEEWLHIATEPKMIKGIHVDRITLWTKLYEKYYIERSLSANVTPRDYVTYCAVTILLISISKLNA